MSGIIDLSLLELSERLESRSLSSVEATRFALDRIERFDGRDGLNAFIHVATEGALAAAAASDARRAAGKALGPLDGVPIALKDLVDTHDMPTTAGSAAFAGRQPGADAPTSAALRAAGAVILGKTNMMEFAYGHPHPEVGETANPWNRTRTAGGSSGGSAAAIAARMAWGAIGSDTGGSIRSPAAYCGVTGLKPTYGLVSLTGVVPLSWSLDHAGPIAPTASDCALMLEAIIGHDPADPASAHPSDIAMVQRELAALRRPDQKQRQIRVGLVPNMFAAALTPGLREQVELAASRLPEAGLAVTEVELPQWAVDLVVPIIDTIFSVEAVAYHRFEAGCDWDRYGPVLRSGLEAAGRVTGYDFVHAQRERLRLASAFAALYEDVDLLAWPSQPIIAPLLGTTDAVVAEAGDPATTIDVEIAATGPANLLGEPGISLPCGFVDGMPVGLHLQGPKFSDALVLRAGTQFQALVGPPPLPDLAG